MKDEPSRGILWARLPGFAPWPARRCSAYEEKLLRDIQPTKVVDPIGVVFLGLKRERAWVVKSNIFPFTQDSWKGKFDNRKLKSDRDYRAAVSEAVHITGITLGPDAASIISDHKKDFEDELSQSCVVCKGSSHSGSLVTCSECDNKSIHWHCFRVDDLNVFSKQWICDDCCVAKNFAVGSVYENEDEGDVKDTSQMTVDNVPFPSLPPLSNYSGSNPQNMPIRGRSSIKDNPSIKVGIDLMKIAVLSAATNQKSSSSTTTTATSLKNVDFIDNTNIPRSTNSNRDSAANKAETSLIKNNNVTIDKQEIPEPLITKLTADDVDDNCFICGEAGEVLLCDYPMCRKVYHQVCVLKVFPSPNTLELAHQQIAYNNEWWCPRHFCLDCGAIEELPVSLYNVPLPQVLYHATFDNSTPIDSNSTQKLQNQQTNLTQTRRNWISDIPQATLLTCAKCPFSLCRQCDVSCTALAAPFLPVELFAASSSSPNNDDSNHDNNHNIKNKKTNKMTNNSSLFQLVPSSTLVPTSSRKTIPRALSSLLNANSDKTSDSNDVSFVSTSLSSPSCSALCCKFCIVSQCMEGNAHILDSQLNYLFPCSRPENMDSSRKNNLRSLTNRIPVSYRQAWQVSRVLETAWVKMTNTRLSLPFLRPLLPLPTSKIQQQPLSQHQEEKAENFDMMYLLEKIHGLQYVTIDDFIRDVHTLRSQLTEKLKAASLASTTNISDINHSKDQHHFAGNMQKQLLLAFDTMEFAGTAFLRRQEARVFTERQFFSTTNATNLVTTTINSTANNNASSNVSENNSNIGNSSRKRRSSAISTVDSHDIKNNNNGQIVSENGNLGKRDITAMLQLLPLCSRLACHLQPMSRPGTLSAVLKVLQDRANQLFPRDEEDTQVSRNEYDANFTQHILRKDISPLSHGSQLGEKQLVMNRSLAAWTEHVATGDARSKFYHDDFLEDKENGDDKEKETGKVKGDRGEFVPNTSALRPKHYLDIPAITSAKNTVKALLQCEEEDVFEEKLPKHPQDFESVQQMMDHDLDVVESILSMKHSLAREDATLPYPHENSGLLVFSNTAASVNSSNKENVLVTSLHPQRQAIYQQHMVQTPLPDDSYNLLSRMKEITQCLFALQQRFTYAEDLKCQQYLSGSVCSRGSNSGVISLGEMGLVAELKLANDNLRWKLQQRDALLESTTVQVAVLQKQLAEQTRQIEMLTQKNNQSK